MKCNSEMQAYVVHNDKKLYLSQQAYISDDGLTYEASAIDDDENNYKIYWDVTCQDADDESDACDWDDFRVVEL